MAENVFSEFSERPCFKKIKAHSDRGHKTLSSGLGVPISMCTLTCHTYTSYTHTHTQSKNKIKSSRNRWQNSHGSTETFTLHCLMEFKATRLCKIYCHAIRLHQFSGFMLKPNTLLNILKTVLFVTEQIENRGNHLWS